MRFIVRILANSLAIYLAAYFVSGVELATNWKTLLLAGFVLSLINSFIKPILKIITLPLIILTFGLFTFLINIFSVWLLIKFIPGLTVASFWGYFWTAIIISVINILFNWLIKKPTREI